jgi:putative ABC transport system permease protein
MKAPGGLSGRVLRLAALLAPGSRRDALLRQWHADLAFRRQRRQEGEPVGSDALWALGALGHAMELRRQEPGFLDAIRVDIYHAARALRRRPGVAVLASGIFAVGIGVATSVFSIVDAVLFRPFPFPEPETLLHVSMENPAIGMDQVSVAWPDFAEFRDVRGVVSAAVHQRRSIDLADDDLPERIDVEAVGPGFFETLRADAVIGRLLSDEDHAVDATDVVVLAEPVWQRRYGADPGVLGRTVRLDGRPYTVVGVVRAEHMWPVESSAWTPLKWGSSVPEWADSRSNFTWQMVARAAPGVTPAVLSERFTSLSLAARRDDGGDAREAAWSARADTFHGAQVGDRAGFVFMLLGAAVLALVLIASFNVAGLLLVRASERARDFSLRSALGAGRTRLFRQLLTESLLLALLGGAAGVLVGITAIRAAVAFYPEAIPRLGGAGLNPAVVLVALVISVVAAVVGGVAPGLQAARADVAGALREGASATSANRGRRRVQRGLVVAQLALSTALLIGGGMFQRALGTALNSDPGFDADDIVVFSVRPPASRYAEDADVQSFFERAQRALESVAVIDGVALTSTVPLGVAGTRLQRSFLLDGMAEPPAGTDVSAQWIEADPELFELLGLSASEGRVFTEADQAESVPVMIINETMAGLLEVDGSPVGRSLRSWYDENVPREIVGVVPDIRMDDTELEARPLVIVPRTQAVRRSMAFLLRSGSDIATVAPIVADRMASIDADVALDGLGTLRSRHRQQAGAISFVQGIFTIFGGAALALGTIGIYGLVAFTVSLRTREIGIRMAIGASKSQVRSRVMRQGLGLTLAGMAAGTVLGGLFAFAITRVLVGQAWLDPVVWTVVPLLLGAATLAATVGPAVRATKVEPVRALAAD